MSTKLNVKPSDQIFPLLGSFWNNQFGQRALARSIAQLGSDHWRAHKHFADGINGFFNPGSGSLQTSPFTVVIDLHSVQLSDSSVNNSPLAQYLVPWEASELPVTIASARGRLFLGSDFVPSGDYLKFYTNPVLLFPDGQVHVEQGTEDAFTLAHQLMRLPPTAFPIDLLVDFFRNNSSLLQFKKCLAVIGGRKFFHKEATVREAIDFGEGVVYRMPDFEMFVPYAHTPLSVGTTYPEGWVIGGGVEVHPVPGEEDVDWWGYRDPEGGLPTNRFGDRLYLFNVLPTRRPICLRNELVPAYSIYTDLEGDPDYTHIRFQVSDDRADDDAFWSYVWKQETRTGKYLNSLVGLPAPPAPRLNFSGPPQCWEEVQLAFLQDRYFAQLFNEPIGTPDLEVLPLELTGMVNPIQMLLEAGVKDFAVFVRIQHTLFDSAPEVFQQFLNQARFLDRIVLVEVDQYTAGEGTTVLPASTATFNAAIDAADVISATSSTLVSTYSAYELIV